MSIKGLGARALGHTHDQATTSRIRKDAGAARSATSGADGFVASDTTARIRGHLDQVRGEPASRSELVERARALVQSGEIDAPENIARAAEGFLAGGA
ncbi:MAG: hypothetical protein R3F20_11730 [Planctomycetota bacterium]